MHDGPAHRVADRSLETVPHIRSILGGFSESPNELPKAVRSPGPKRVARRSERLRGVGTGVLDPALQMPAIDLTVKEMSNGEGHEWDEHMASKRRKTALAV